MATAQRRAANRRRPARREAAGNLSRPRNLPQAESSELVSAEQRDPDRAVRTSPDPERTAPRLLNIGHHTGRRDLRELFGIELREPEVAVGSGHDVPQAEQLACDLRELKLGDKARGRDAADSVGENQREPEIPVRTCGDSIGPTGQSAELDDVADRIDPTDLADAVLRKPQRAVRPHCDARRVRRWSRNRKERELASRREPHDRVSEALGEPQVFVGTARNAAWNDAAWRLRITRRKA